MKNANLVSAAAIVAFIGLAFSATAMGYLPPEDILETPDAVEAAPVQSDAAEANLQKCTPHKKVPDQVCYISGGVDSDEVAEFKLLAKNFLLEVVFVQKADLEVNNRIEEYLASVNLQIKDAKGNMVIEATTDGPFFLADLPPGKYQISAEHDGIVKTNLVHVDAKKHQRVVFLWDRQHHQEQ